MGTLTWPLPNSGNMMRNTMLLLALVLVLDFAVGTYQVESMVRPAVPKPTYIRKRYGADPPAPASSNYRRRYGAEPQAPAGSAYRRRSGALPPKIPEYRRRYGALPPKIPEYRRRYGAVVPPAAASSNYRRRYSLLET